MKIKIRSIMMICLLVGTLLLISGCSGAETPYQLNDKDGYDVSVKFDANGGTFTTNVTVIVDSFNVTDMATDANGDAQIALIAPDDAKRGDKNLFKPTLNDHFLLGWYAERTEDPDGEGYTYSKKWDFEKDRLSVDVDAEHSASEPVITLYAVWAPMYEIEFFDRSTDELIGSFSYDPNLTQVIVPSWDQEKGTIDMEKFPKKSGYTFEAAYYDKEGTRPVDTETVEHIAKIDETTGTVTDPTMPLYVDWMEGDWYHIYTAEQFSENASPSGNYVIHADLDFTDVGWPFMHGNFSGAIYGNGYTFKNIEAVQTQNSKTYSGLFGNVTESAKFIDLTLDNVVFTIQGGTRVIGASFGLFAGNINEAAQIEDVTITNSQLQIDSGIYPDAEYSIGLISAMGNVSAIDLSGISCSVVGDAPETLLITVENGLVEVKFVDEIIESE